MPYCTHGGHRCAATPIAVYYVAPGDGALTGDRWRLKSCLHHGRQLLQKLYRYGFDLESDGEEPELCFGCGNPAHSTPVEVRVYEGEWSAAFGLVVCDDCDPATPNIVVEAAVGAEKLPPREKRRKRT